MISGLYIRHIAQNINYGQQSGYRIKKIYHSMAKVHWEAFYVKKDGSDELVDFDVIYLVQLIGEKPKIFAYIAGDEQKLLKEKGLISE